MDLHLVPDIHAQARPSYPVSELPRPIVVVDGRLLIRESLTMTLACHGRDVEGVAHGWESAYVTEDDDPATVLLCGASLEDVAWDLRWLGRQGPRCRTLVICDVGDGDTALRALQNGASGYISATANLDSLFVAIEAVEEGGTYAPTECLMAMLTGEASPHRWHALFNPRQIAILEAIQHGKPDKVIASELGLSPATIKINVKNLRERFGARNRTELAFKFGFPEMCGDLPSGLMRRRKATA